MVNACHYCSKLLDFMLEFLYIKIYLTSLITPNSAFQSTIGVIQMKELLPSKNLAPLTLENHKINHFFLKKHQCKLELLNCDTTGTTDMWNW